MPDGIALPDRCDHCDSARLRREPFVNNQGRSIIRIICFGCGRTREIDTSPGEAKYCQNCDGWSMLEQIRSTSNGKERMTSRCLRKQSHNYHSSIDARNYCGAWQPRKDRR